MTINNKSERNYRGKCLDWPVTSYGGAGYYIYDSPLYVLKKREKNGVEKEEKNYRKRTINMTKKAIHKSKTKRKNGNRNTHVYVSWSFVSKLCLQVDLRFAFTVFYR